MGDTKTFIVLLLIAHGIINVHSQLYEDEACITDDGVEGVCKLLQRCAVAKEGLKNKSQVKPKICSFDKNLPVVCCLDPGLVPRPQRPQYQFSEKPRPQQPQRPTEQPQQPFEQPQQPFEQPQQPFEQPQQPFEQPQQPFEQPQQPFEQPQQPFEQPQQPFEQPQQPFEQPQQPFEQPQQGFAQPQQPTEFPAQEQQEGVGELSGQDQGALEVTSKKPPRRQTQWWQKPKKTTPSF